MQELSPPLAMADRDGAARVARGRAAHRRSWTLQRARRDGVHAGWRSSPPRSSLPGAPRPPSATSRARSRSPDWRWSRCCPEYAVDVLFAWKAGQGPVVRGVRDGEHDRRQPPARRRRLDRWSSASSGCGTGSSVLKLAETHRTGDRHPRRSRRCTRSSSRCAAASPCSMRRSSSGCSSPTSCSRRAARSRRSRSSSGRRRRSPTCRS